MKDKIKHLVFGMLIALAVGLPCCVSSLDLFSGLWGCLAGVIAGGVKEWCDMQTDGNRWDWVDFAFTCVGVVLAMMIVSGVLLGKG